MIGKLKALLGGIFEEMPRELQPEFLAHCAQKNNSRFSILPAFNIFTQISCYFIYLYIYPATFPERPQLDPALFTMLSVAYLLMNGAFLFLFNRQRRRADSPGYVAGSNTLLVVFLLFYVISESVETIMEVEISGNIYRFLATFFMVAVLPSLRRGTKFSLLVLFAGCVEAGLAVLVRGGYTSSNRFREIVLVFLLAYLVVANITYNNTVRTFSLQHSIVAVNEELRMANERLQHLALIDPLTQIANRRAFDQFMSLAWRSACRDGRLLAVIMADIDHFKNYNDTYGHQQGDECLCAVAACIDGCFQRDTDMVARYGGEEFIVLLVQDDSSHIQTMAERMRLRVEELGLEHKSSAVAPHVTVSVGLAAVYPTRDMRYENLIKKADDALYKAKESGRNRVCADLGGTGGAPSE